MEKATVKKILRSVLSFAVLIIALNYVYTFFFLESDIQKHSPIINLVRKIPDKTDIIYIGESSNVTFREDDLDKRPISGFIADYFPELNVYDITKPAAHAGIYKVLLEKIPEKSNIKTVIVTLNLRSFNAGWQYSNLETSLQKSIVLLKPYPPIVNRFLLSFKAYDIKTDKERSAQVRQNWESEFLNLPFTFQHKNVNQWDYWMAKNGIKDSLNNIDSSKTELACHYIKGFAFQIDTIQNPRIKDFNDIVKLANNRGWNLIFNLMAENTEKADKLVGDELIYFIENNRNTIINYYEAKGVTVVDNLNSVGNDEFVDQNWTTEHYAEKGRQKIAQNVAEKVKIFYPDDYVAAKIKPRFQTTFYNNCDENTTWGQMQTLTNEISFSGEMSSKIGGGEDYSITLEYPLKVIPDSLKSKVNIDFKVYQKSKNNQGKLVLQAHGKDFTMFWQGTDLKTQISKVNEWMSFSTTFIIPDSIKNADIIKIYVYNPSNEIIYIDNFTVEFE